ncbi:MAG: hypothetical protein WBG46_01755 [Nonlabens sp.]
MKTVLLQRLLFIVLPLCASMCCPEEEDWNFTNYSKNVWEVSRIVNDQTTYTVGDTLFIETVINVDQEFDEATLELDQITINNDGEGYFQFNMAFYRLSDFGSPSRINVATENFVESDGTTYSNNGFITGLTILENDQFKHTYGIVLREAGTYSLGGSLNDEEVSFPINYYFRANDIIIDLYSQLNTTTLSGNFEFEVVE